MNPTNPKIQVKKLNFGTISLTTQKASFSTSRNIRIKLSESIHNTCSNKMLPISRNRPQNKLLAFTLNSIRGKYQTQTGTNLSSRTGIDTSLLNNKQKNNIPSFTLYSKVSSTSRNKKNMTSRLFTITNPTNSSLINLNTMMEKSLINTSNFSPSINGSINSSFHRGSIVQSKLKNKKVVMKQYSTSKEQISLINRKKQLISQEVENENNKDYINKLKKIPLVNFFIQRKILYLWRKNCRYNIFKKNKNKLQKVLNDDHLIYNNQFKYQVNDLVLQKIKELSGKNIINNHNYERFFNEYSNKFNESISKVYLLKNNSMFIKNKQNLNMDLHHPSNKNITSLFINKQSISKIRNSFQSKKGIKTIHKTSSNMSSIKKEKEEIILMSSSEYYISNILKKLENKMTNNTFLIEYYFHQNELIQKPLSSELIKQLEAIIDVLQKENPNLLKEKSKILHLKKLFEEKNKENIEQQCLYLCYYNDIENYSFEEINSLNTSIKNECIIYSYEKAKEALIIAFKESIKSKTDQLLKQLNQICESLLISENYTFSNIQIIKYQMVNILKRISQSTSLCKDDYINRKYNQLQQKIEYNAKIIKEKYPLITLRKKIDNIEKYKDYTELNEIITLVMIHQNIQYDKIETILLSLDNYFHHYNNNDSLYKIPKLYNEMIHNKDYDPTFDQFKNIYTNYSSLLNNINESSKDYYNQLFYILSFREQLNDYYRKKKKTTTNQFNVLYNEFKQNEEIINCLLQKFIAKINHIDQHRNTSITTSNKINDNQKNSSKIQFTIHIIDNINTELHFEILYSKYFKQKLKYKKLIHIFFRDFIIIIIDREFEDILSQLCNLSNEFSQDQVDTIHSLLYEYKQSKTKQHLEKIQNIIKSIIINKRSNLTILYPKFQLLTESEIIYVEKSVLSIQLIKSIFSKINQKKDLILSENNNNIIGVNSLKEKIMFGKNISIDKTKKIKNNYVILSSLFTTIDNEISSILDLQIMDSLNSFNKKQFHQWANSYLSQVTVCSLSLIFTNEITQVLTNLSNQKKSPSNHKTEYDMITDKYMQWIKTKDKIIEQSHMNLVLTIINHLNIIDSLIKSNTNNIESFDWLKYLRHLWDQNKKQVIIECGGWSNYQLKNFIVQDRILLTPETDKVFLFTSSCFREKSASIVKISNKAFSYKEIFNEYATLFWAEMISISIINIESITKIKTIFDIATINKNWVFLENIDLLDNKKGINYLIYLSKFMQVIQQEVILNDIKFNNSERMFCLMGCINLTERIKFKENALKSSSRVMNFIKPDPEYYYKNLLKFFGTKLIKKDLNKVKCLIQKKENNMKLIKEHYYNDFDFFNAMMRYIVRREITILTENHLISFVNNYSMERTENMKSNQSNISSQIESISSSKKIQAYCEENDVIYDQSLLDGLIYLIEYVFQSDNSSNNLIPVIVGYGKTYFIQLFFSYINYMSSDIKIYYNFIHHHSLQKFYSDFILRIDSSNSNTNMYSNQTQIENRTITLIKLLFWEKELSYIKGEKLLITLKEYNKENIAKIETNLFKVIRLPELKSKKLLKRFIVKLNKSLLPFNVILSDEYSLALSEFIKAIIQNQIDNEVKFAYSLQEFSNWAFKLVEYCSNHKIHLDTKIIFNLIIQALLMTFPQNYELIDYLKSTVIQMINKQEISGDFQLFCNQPNIKQWIKYDMKRKQFTSFVFEDYKKDMCDYIKTLLTHENLIIITNDSSLNSLLPNSKMINDMFFQQNVIDFDYSAILKETMINDKNSITTYVTPTSKTLYDNSRIGIYMTFSKDQWKNISNVFDNWYKLFIYKNESKEKIRSSFIQIKDYPKYSTIINLFNDKLNQDDEKFIYSLINPINDLNETLNYTDINFDLIFSMMFQQNKIFNVIINYESEKQMKLFTLIKKYFNNYDLIYGHQQKTKSKKQKSTVLISIGYKIKNDEQHNNNTCYIFFNEKILLSLISHILKLKFQEIQLICNIVKKSEINQLKEVIHIIHNEPFIINNIALLSKMLYDVFHFDEKTFNLKYKNHDLLIQLIHYLLHSVNDHYYYKTYFLKFNSSSSYSQCKILMKYLKHGYIKSSVLSISSFPLSLIVNEQCIKYTNELIMIISHTLNNYSFLISQQEIINSQAFYINFIHTQLPKKQSVLINTILEKIYLSVANHFLFSILLTFEIMVNNYEMSKDEQNYIINYLKNNFIFHNNNSIKFKYESNNNNDFIKSKGKDLIYLYQSKNDGCSDDFLKLVEKALNINSKYFYTSNLNTINKDIDKLLYYMTFIPEQSPSIFKYLINKYLRPLYSIDKFKVNSFLKKKSIAPITIKADSCINITNFLCSLAAYYEIQFIVIRTLSFDLNNNDLGYKYIVDGNISATITEAMAKGYWLFISAEVNIIEFLKIADLIYCSSNNISNGKFKLFFDQNLIKEECNDLIANYTLLLQIDNNNIDDLEAAHDMWVNVLEENILSESLMDETQKDFLDLNSGAKNNVSAISDKDLLDKDIASEYSDLTFLSKI